MTAVFSTSIAVFIVIRMLLIIGQLCRAYAPTNNPGGHDYHEKSS